MLVITRTVGKSFRIGDDVVVVVADTDGLAVKFGLEAPKHIQVHRQEVHERIGATSSQMAE